MAQAESKRGAGETFSSDAWDGCPAAWQRLLTATADSRAHNPIVLGGDVHSFWVTDLTADCARERAPVIATELVTTSVSSTPIAEAVAADIRDENPHVRYGQAGPHGYLRMQCTATQVQAGLRGLDNVTDVHAACRTLASFVETDGEPGAQRN